MAASHRTRLAALEQRSAPARLLYVYGEHPRGSAGQYIRTMPPDAPGRLLTRAEATAEAESAGATHTIWVVYDEGGIE